MISTYAEKKLQSSSNGVAFAVAGAMFLAIGASAFGSFVFGALGWGETDYGLDSGMVALMAFVLPGVYLLYRWRKTAARKALFKSYVYAIDEIEYPLIDLMALVGRSWEETDRDLRELIGIGLYPGAYIDRKHALFVRSQETEAHMLKSLGDQAPADTTVADSAYGQTQAPKRLKPVDPDIRDLVVQCPQCGELNYRSADLETCSFCGANLKEIVHGR